VVDSTGTAQAILMLSQRFISSPQIARQTFACYGHTLPGFYVFKGGLKAAGGGLEWLARQLSGVNANSKLAYAELEAAARTGVGRKAGPLWLPHLNGAGSPEADRRSRAALVGAALEHEAGDVFRGFLEALAFALRNNVEYMQKYTHQKVDEVTLIGGGARFGLLTELKADVLNKPVSVPEVPEASAVGAALLAGLGSGAFKTPEEAFRVLRYQRKLVLPDPRRVEWYDRYFKEVYQPLFSALIATNAALERLNTPGE
jgi:xylulokinase